MTNWLMGTAAILAFVCANTVMTPAFAQDEGTGDTGEEVTDPMPDEGWVDGGEVTIGEGEEVLYDGEVVPYGPEDCIDCNVAPTTVDLDGRPEGENFRGDALGEALSRSTADSSDAICDHTKMGKAATVCE